MKTGLLLLCIFLAVNARSQESVKVPDIPFAFEYIQGSKSSLQPVNDTLFATVAKKGSNHNISLLDKNQKILCSCQFKPSGKQEQFETIKEDT